MCINVYKYAYFVCLLLSHSILYAFALSVSRSLALSIHSFQHHFCIARRFSYFSFYFIPREYFPQVISFWYFKRYVYDSSFLSIHFSFTQWCDDNLVCRISKMEIINIPTVPLHMRYVQIAYGFNLWIQCACILSICSFFPPLNISVAIRNVRYVLFLFRYQSKWSEYWMLQVISMCGWMTVPFCLLIFLHFV